MHVKFGYDSDEEAKNNWQEILEKDKFKKEKYSCDQCVFVSKSGAGLKTHAQQKHKGN